MYVQSSGLILRKKGFTNTSDLISHQGIQVVNEHYSPKS